MDLTEQDVIQILQLMGESDFNELHLEIGDLKLVVNKRNGAAPLNPHSQLVAANDTKITRPDLAPNDSPTLSGDQTTNQAIGPSTISEDRLGTIKAPMLGIFYRAPKPDSPPFVDVGSVIEEDTTVCIIEVMKLFTTIKAGQCGRITSIYPENGALVEYDQVLFSVEPNLA